jgi:methionyl-tRNA formyltransferase
LRIAFFGTPVHAVPYLDVITAEHELVAVVTQPDKPRGRSGALMAPPVKEAALELGVPVCQPDRCGCDELHDTLVSQGTDLVVVVAYGQILPCHLLDLPRFGAVNVHYSLLPKLRGAAPVQHAILEGLTETGVTVQYVAERVDSGDVIAQRATYMLPEDRTDTLTARLTILGTSLMGEVLEALETGRAPRRPQDDADATFAPLLRKQDGCIDWANSAVGIDRQARGCYPWPIAWVGDAAPLRIMATRVARSPKGDHEPGEIVEVARDGGVVVACGEGTVLITEVQPAGRRRMSAADYLRGARLAVGDRLS